VTDRIRLHPRAEDEMRPKPTTSMAISIKVTAQSMEWWLAADTAKKQEVSSLFRVRLQRYDHAFDALTDEDVSRTFELIRKSTPESSASTDNAATALAIFAAHCGAFRRPISDAFRTAPRADVLAQYFLDQLREHERLRASGKPPPT